MIDIYKWREKDERRINTLISEWKREDKLYYLLCEHRKYQEILDNFPIYPLVGTSIIYVALLEKQSKTLTKLEKSAKILSMKSNGGVSDQDKLRAKDYPIEDLFEGKTKGIRCFAHDDHRPSASIRYNRLRCFVCNRSWDSIQVLIERDGYTFSDAVKRLV